MFNQIYYSRYIFPNRIRFLARKLGKNVNEIVVPESRPQATNVHLHDRGEELEESYVYDTRSFKYPFFYEVSSICYVQYQAWLGSIPEQQHFFLLFWLLFLRLIP